MRKTQFHLSPEAITTIKNSKTSKAGTAKMPDRIFATFRLPAAFRVSEPNSTAANTTNNTSHRPILKEETEPSAKPIKKK